MSTKNILITGASSGIGRALARELGKEHHIIVGGRNQQAVDELVAELPSAEPFLVDVTDEAALEQAVSGLDKVDVLVNSAGALWRGPSEEFSRTDWYNGFNLNVFAAVDLTNRLLPKLRESHGDVVFLNSGSGLYTYPGGTLYCATKFALKGFADALREEERGNGVRVISIHPGRVDTEMQVKAHQEQNLEQPYDGTKYVTADAVAKTIRLTLETPREATIETVVVRPSQP